MVRVSVGDSNVDYNLYAVAGFIFSLFFAAAVSVMIFIPIKNLSVKAVDYANGIFLAGALFGVPVVILLGTSGYIYSKLRHQKGKLLALFSIFMSVVFIVMLAAFWYPRKVGFWDYNFSSVNKAADMRGF